MTPQPKYQTWPIEELVEAYFDCRRNKHNKVSALAFELALEDNLGLLHCQLNDGTYTPSSTTTFVVEYPVTREIFAADFRDRIVHHLLIGRLSPLFERKFIFDSYACRPGKGTLFGVKRLRRFIAQCSQNYSADCYVLKCDILGFFMHIDRRRLWSLLCQWLPADRPMAEVKLLQQIVMHDPTQNYYIAGSKARWNKVSPSKSLFAINGKPLPNGYLPHRASISQSAGWLGLPIGNLTSQWFANFYLDGLDHYLKHNLGMRYYGRYVDDMVLVHPNKERLKEVVHLIDHYLKTQLGLQLHPRKTQLQHYTKGVTFLGVRQQGRGALLVGQRTKEGLLGTIDWYNAQAALGIPLTVAQLSVLRCSINSYWGIVRHLNSYRLREASARRMNAELKTQVSVVHFDKIIVNNFLKSPKRSRPSPPFRPTEAYWESLMNELNIQLQQLKITE